MKFTLLTTAMIALACTAQADLHVTFDEGTPKDRFTFANMSDCALPSATLALDLTNSAGALVFDVTDQGAGVEVFQPFELVAGGDTVTDYSAVKDGDKTLSLAISGLAARAKVAFTIDVDDTLGQQEITVNDTEISGAIANVTQSSGTTSATFNGDTAVIALNCPS